MICINFIKVLDALTGAYSYNMDEDAMDLLYQELIDRFNCKDCVRWLENQVKALGGES